MRRRALVVTVSLAAVFTVAPAVLVAQQNGAALTGQVTSPGDGAMEGVLVSAKKAGSTVTVTVVTDAQGRYRFPVAKLGAGQYALTIRAVGYELDGPDTVTLPAQKTTDLKLRTTKDLAAQLTNAEWIMSIPGQDEAKK